jgi:hypothetical protein
MRGAANFPETPSFAVCAGRLAVWRRSVWSLAQQELIYRVRDRVVRGRDGFAKR